MENIAEKIEQARSALYKMNGPLVNPEIVRASKKLDELINDYYKEQGCTGRLVPGGNAAVS